jgi:glycogen(starch) synthase
MWNLTRAIPWMAEQLLPGRVVYYVADHWPYTPDTHAAYWRDMPVSPLRRTFKRLLAPLALRVLERDQQRYTLAFGRVLCVSQAIRQTLLANTTIPAERVQVVYNGIDLHAFAFQPRQRRRGEPLRLLYAGSLVPHKGVHCAVAAMAHLARQDALDGLTLTLVGSGRPDYEARLRAAVQEHGLEKHVVLAGRVPREAMPAQLACHDALIFPSQWPEPLARMTQEAMASGAVVIGTTTGGTGEILVEGETGLVFAPGDAEQLARRILELRDDPGLYSRLAANARRRVEGQFDFQLMLDHTEAHLLEAAAAQASVASGASVYSR